VTRHYLDHASTSPLRPESAAAMAEALTGIVGDPGRIHHEGMVARHAVETARQQVTDMLDARGREVVFTSGATESIAMACWGASRRDGRRHSVMSAVEHSAVRRGLRLDPLLLGGEQERARRAGLENVPAVVGFGAAAAALDPLRLAVESLEATRRTDLLRSGLDAALDALPGILADLRSLR